MPIMGSLYLFKCSVFFSVFISVTFAQENVPWNPRPCVNCYGYKVRPGELYFDGCNVCRCHRMLNRSPCTWRKCRWNECFEVEREEPEEGHGSGNYGYGNGYYNNGNGYRYNGNGYYNNGYGYDNNDNGFYDNGNGYHGYGPYIG